MIANVGSLLDRFNSETITDTVRGTELSIIFRSI